ncbi:phosphoenolpyruvate--protein phosphotransferase [Kineococcus sp. NUM-3379]
MSGRTLRGRGVSAGTACAPLARMRPPVRTSPADPPGRDPEVEAARVTAALDAVAAELTARAERAGGVAADVLRTTAAMAQDRALRGAAQRRVRAGGPTAHSVTGAAGELAARLEALGGVMAERALDVRDVGARAAAHLLGVAPPGLPSPGHPVVLTARDLAPADTATLPGSDVVALLTEEGGPTSHTAILARSLGIPAVVGCPGAAAVAEGTTVLLDGSSGTVEVDPPPGRRPPAPVPGAAAAPAADPGPGRTRDGVPVALLSNVGTLDEAAHAAATGSEGVGLLRTEFLFLGRRERPSVQEQAECYRAVLEAFGTRRVVVRTLDAGSDKPLAFLPLGAEENPALGVRGLRTRCVHPEALAEQLTALARAAADAGRDVAVMAPMVSTAEEAAAFAALARGAGLREVGVMVEVPAAALRAADVLAEVDFASVGTNDLGQYAMAADRAAGALGDLLDPWQPALLDLVAAVGDAGRRTGRPVGVCGEAAADPLLAAVLVGLGVTSLSTAVRARPAVHAQLSRLGAADCAALAAAARGARSAAGARQAASRVREEVLATG